MTLQCTLLSLLVTFVAACSAGAHDAAGAGETPSVTDPKTVPAAGNVERTFPSMCAAQESVLFSCETQTGKGVSLCASGDVGQHSGYLYYAYGSPAKPEFVFPAEKRPPIDFRRTQLGFAGSTGGYAYSFENGGYRYVVYSISGAAGREEQGVLVSAGEPRTAIASQPCREGSVIEDGEARLLDLTLRWPVDPDIDRHGLPRRK